MTKSRAAGRDFWLMSASRRLTIDELLRLQGFSAHDLNLEGVSDRQVGEMVGNAMSVPVLSSVLHEGLSVYGMRWAGLFEPVSPGLAGRDWPV